MKMKSKILMTLIILLMITIVYAEDVGINKYFDKENKKIEIEIDFKQGYGKIKVIDYLPFCLDAQDISHDGILKSTREGVFFIEWNLDTVSGTMILSYTPVEVYECGDKLTLSPPRVIIEEETFYGEKTPIGKEELEEMEEKICVINRECEYPSENYFNCPQDCPSGSKDGVCDERTDGKCDPDCEPGLDPDCCNNNGVCESELGENYENCPEDCHCGNNKCERNLGESHGNCPEDCPSGYRDNFCDGKEDGRCDPDCEEKDDIDCKEEKQLKISWLIVVPIILVIILIIFYIFFYRKSTGNKKRVSKNISS